MNIRYIILTMLILIMLAGIILGDFMETWKNGALL